MVVRGCTAWERKYFMKINVKIFHTWKNRMNFRYWGIFWSLGPEHHRAEYPVDIETKLKAAKWAVF